VGDLHATAEFPLGEMRNQAMIGAAFTNAESDSDWGYGAQNEPIDPSDPVYTGIAGPVAVTDYPESTLEQQAVYVQDRAIFRERLFVDVGLRYDRIDTVQPTWEGAETSSASDNELSTSASILYATDFGLAPYFSYAEAFAQEISGSDREGNPFEPMRGKQYELGMKYQPPGTASIFSAAVFDLTKSNLAIPDPVDPNFNKQIGEARVHGLELEAKAEFGGVSVDAAYTYLDTEDENGYRIYTVPEHLASLWLEYAPQRLRGWKGGVGVRHVGESWDGTDTLATPSVTLYDAMLGYETERYDIMLTGRNLADKTYVASCTALDCYYGDTLTIGLTATAKF